MATPYEELTELAIADSRDFYQERSDCSNCIEIAISKLTQYLQAPLDSVSFVKLDKDLHRTDETSGNPILASAPDRAWHFGVQIQFRDKSSLHFGVVRLSMSIQPSGDNFVLRFDREFSVNPKQPDSFNPFVEYVYSSLAADYKKPRRTRRQQIGFTAGS